jgi:hypothetical protein
MNLCDFSCYADLNTLREHPKLSIFDQCMAKTIRNGFFVAQVQVQIRIQYSFHNGMQKGIHPFCEVPGTLARVLSSTLARVLQIL